MSLRPAEGDFVSDLPTPVAARLRASPLARSAVGRRRTAGPAVGRRRRQGAGRRRRAGPGLVGDARPRRRHPAHADDLAVRSVRLDDAAARYCRRRPGPRRPGAHPAGRRRRAVARRRSVARAGTGRPAPRRRTGRSHRRRGTRQGARRRRLRRPRGHGGRGPLAARARAVGGHRRRGRQGRRQRVRRQRIQGGHRADRGRRRRREPDRCDGARRRLRRAGARRRRLGGRGARGRPVRRDRAGARGRLRRELGAASWSPRWRAVPTGSRSYGGASISPTCWPPPRPAPPGRRSCRRTFAVSTGMRCTRLALAQVAVVGMFTPGDDVAEARLRLLGVDHVLPADTPARDIAAAVAASLARRATSARDRTTGRAGR